eukprot:gene36205-44657_t
MSNPTLYYWPIKGRNYAILVAAQGGGIKVDVKSDFDMAELKPTLPFGQVPYLVDGDVKIAQSNDILRYIAKKGGIQGDSDQDYALSEMLIEEVNDIMNIWGKAIRSENKNAEYDTIFSATGDVTKHLTYLENLLPGGESPFFRPSKRVVGGYAVGCLLDCLQEIQPSIFDNFPKLKAFYDAIIVLPAYDGLRDLPLSPYAKRNA